MQLRLRTKLTLVMTGLVLLVVAVISGVFVARVTRQVIRQANERALFVAHMSFEQARHALEEFKGKGLLPDSGSPEDVRDYVRKAFESDPALDSLLKSATAEPSIYEVTISDHEGLVLASSDATLPGKIMPRRTPLAGLLRGNFFQEMRRLYGAEHVYEVDFPFNKGGEPFGEVRVGMSARLLRDEITLSLRASGSIVVVALLISTLLAAVVSRATLAPLADISAQLDRISAGQYDAPSPEAKDLAGSGDELGQVQRKITRVGQQLRGVHEIFSTLRENMNSVMAGLEDGLLLFTRDARAVMVSPAAEKFLGAPSGQFLGRRVNEIFPAGHALHEALGIEGDELSEVAAEVELPTSEGMRRVSVSVQAIQEDGERMGALVTLRDLDSLESINTQLQVSERLAAMGRITA